MQYNITYRQKDKGWQYIISYKDAEGKWKQKSKQGFDKKKEAQISAEQHLNELKKRIALTANVETKYKEITFGQFAKDLIEHERLHKAENTIRNREYSVVKFADINSVPLVELKNSDIQKCVDKMIKDKLKISTIKTYLISIKYILNQAVKPYKIISVSPIDEIKLPALQYSDDDAGNTVKTLGKEDITKIMDFLKSKKMYMPYYYLCSLALGTGLRRGELLGLTWENVDFKNREIHVVKQWKWINKDEEGFGTLKKKNSKRVVPISKNTLDKLVEYKKIYNVINMDNRVFPFSINSTIGFLDRASSQLKTKIRLHEMRHTYATNLIASGLDFKTAAAILGHDIEMTMKVYSHVTDDMMKRAAAKIDLIF